MGEQKEDKVSQTEKLDGLIIPEIEKGKYTSIGRKCIKEWIINVCLNKPISRVINPKEGRDRKGEYV